MLCCQLEFPPHVDPSKQRFLASPGLLPAPEIMSTKSTTAVVTQRPVLEVRTTAWLRNRVRPSVRSLLEVKVVLSHWKVSRADESLFNRWSLHHWAEIAEKRRLRRAWFVRWRQNGPRLSRRVPCRSRFGEGLHIDDGRWERKIRFPANWNCELGKTNAPALGSEIEFVFSAAKFN